MYIIYMYIMHIIYIYIYIYKTHTPLAHLRHEN